MPRLRFCLALAAALLAMSALRATPGLSAGTIRRGRSRSSFPSVPPEVRPPMSRPGPDRAPDRQHPAGEFRPALRDREPHRRRRRDRHARGRQVAARRLYAVDDVEYPDRERIAGADAQIRIDARSGADRAGQLLRPRHRRASLGAGEDAGGIHRARQIAAGKAELRLVRPGHALSHGRRTVQNHGRHRCRARSLPQQRRGAQRRHRRTGADDDRRGSGDGPQCR